MKTQSLNWHLNSLKGGIEEHREAITQLEEQTETILLIANVIAEGLKGGGKLIAFGNGGSAADAQHLVAELVGRLAADRPALPAIALTTNTSNLTAIANDYSYEDVFARQIDALGKSGDVAVGLATSGDSPNVLQATRRASDLGLVTIGLTGRAGGGLRRIAEHCLSVGNNTPRAQEAHITAIHLICAIIEGEIFGQHKSD